MIGEESVYTEHILDHAEDPFHKGHLPNPTHIHEEKNPLCGDKIHIEMIISDDGKIEDLYFDGEGCKHSQAGASMLLEEMFGKTTQDVSAFRAKDMMDLMGVRLTPRRQQCALLAWKVLQSAIYSPVKATDE